MNWKSLLVVLMLAGLSVPASAQEVLIKEGMLEVKIDTATGPVVIKRNQDQNANIDPDFAKTSRKCPPFCVQPIEAAPGVKTVAELEVIDFLAKKDGVLLDARTQDWHLRGTIPGSVNIPYTEVGGRLNELGCQKNGAAWTCGGAKKVAVYCNGPWCGQSHAAIAAMIKAGYPADRILYYRGGVQGWKSLGFNTVEGSL
ncbi:MAG: rhodanese-like domain-containing protein [Alphaproteobacteria bacterium]|nr:rhodanese-like domain-containing protein [Alphaproteobacteria bacterium]